MSDIACSSSRALLLAREDSSSHEALMNFLIIYVLQIYVGTHACNPDKLQDPQLCHVSFQNCTTGSQMLTTLSCPTISTTISTAIHTFLPLSGCRSTWSSVTREGAAPPTPLHAALSGDQDGAAARLEIPWLGDFSRRNWPFRHWLFTRRTESK